MDGLVHLFIIWKNGRHKEGEIVNLIKQKFQILKKYEITWTPEKFRNNLSSLYCDDFTNDSFQEEHRGNGEFLVIIVKDLNPIFENRKTNNGIELVNINAFEFKYKIRNEILHGDFQFHATNNLKETKHDLVLLLGQNLNDFLQNTKLNGSCEKLQKDLPCVRGWKNLEEVFYVLNDASDYCLLRCFDKIPYKHTSQDGDIDILTNDMQNIIAILDENNNLKKNAFRFFNYIKVGNDTILFHLKFVGDDYYDINWQRKILNTKILNKNNCYIPNDEMYFYSLLYHGIIHKTNYLKYNETLTNLAKKLNIKDFKLDIKYLIKLLGNWLKNNNYKYTLHLDKCRGFHKENVYKNSLIKKKKDYLLYSNFYGCHIFEKELIFQNPELATFMCNYCQLTFISFENHLIDLNSKKYRKYKKFFSKNSLFVYFRKRFGNILVSKGFLDKDNKIEIKKYFLGHFGKINTEFFILSPEKKRKFIDGTILFDIIQNIKYDIEKLKQCLEIFICEVFRQFKTDDNLTLNGIAFDMVPQNCIIDNDGRYKFIDFEYSLKGGINKSFMIYRILRCAGTDIDYKMLYDYFCDKFKLSNNFIHDEWFNSIFFDKIYLSPREPKKSLLKKIIANILTSFIPGKKYREKSRKKLKKFMYFRKLRLYKKYFGEDNI